MWFSGYRACHFTQGSRVQSRQRRMDFLRAMKIRSMTLSGGEVRPLAPCRRFLGNVIEP
jgi:hypothetical protein